MQGPVEVYPELSDEQVKGQFIFARGPVLYQPRRLIAIPSESEFMLRVSKEQGGNTATCRVPSTRRTAPSRSVSSEDPARAAAARHERQARARSA